MYNTADGSGARVTAGRLIIYAAVVTALTFSPARAGVNKALRFDGTDDYVRLPVNHRTACPVTDFTVEFWMKVESAGQVFGAWKYIGISASAASVGLTIWPDDTETRFTVPVTGYSDEWTYLALVRRDTTLTGYVNGTEANAMTVPAGSFDMFSGWGGQHIGSGVVESADESPKSCFGGMLDEFRISGTARTAAEILANWNGGNGMLLQADTSTLALWHFDEGEGAMLHDVTMWNNGWLGWYASGDTSCMPAWDDGVPFPGPTGDFALYTPNFHARLGVPVLAVITGAAATDKFQATLTGPGVNTVVCEEDGPLPVELRFALDLRDLAAGDYTFTTRLLNAGDNELKRTEKTFNKPYDGAPATGIDENNGLVVDGKRIFPFGAFNLYLDRIPTWVENGYMNSQNGTGFGGHTFTTALGICAQEDIGMIGGAECWDTDTLTDVVNGSKDHGSMWAWGLPDEPDLYGIDAATVMAATDAIHAADPRHPTWVNYMGHPYRATTSAFWTSVAVGNSFPNLVADIYCFDYYPVYVTTANSTTFDEEIITLADKVCDHVRDWNYDLVPVHSYVECTQFDADHPEPTAGQIRLITWVNIIHGVKGIMWFPWHWISSISDEIFAEMARLCREANQLAPVIFSPDLSGVVVKEELSGGRVDIMSKECNDSIYIFAANMKAQAEACRFTLEASLSGGTAAVFDSSLAIPLTGRTFTDTLLPFSVRIYSVPGTAVPIADRPAPDAHNLEIAVRPNPFSMTGGSSVITFTSPSSAALTVTVTTLAGRSVWQGFSATGGNITWNVDGTTGGRTASGVYLYSIVDESGGWCTGRVFIR